DGVPWAIKRTPGCMVAGGHSPLLSRLLMHIPRERLDVLERRRRQNAMAEIENVAVSSARARQHIVGGERVEDPPCVREDELAVVARVQRADPRVEDLHRVDAGFNLRDEIVADDAGEEIAEAMPRRRG